jgi:DNA polymerase-3 subunit alpha
MTRRGKMAFVALDDGEAQVEVAVFNELFERNRDLLREDQLLLVEGKVSKDDYSGGLRVTADKLFGVTEARTRYAKGMRLAMNGQADAAKLRDLLGPYRRAPAGEEAGGCLVTIRYHNQGGACEMTLGDGWRVELDDNLLISLKEWLSEEGVNILYP